MKRSLVTLTMLACALAIAGLAQAHAADSIQTINNTVSFLAGGQNSMSSGDIAFPATSAHHEVCIEDADVRVSTVTQPINNPSIGQLGATVRFWKAGPDVTSNLLMEISLPMSPSALDVAMFNSSLFYQSSVIGHHCFSRDMVSGTDHISVRGTAILENDDAAPLSFLTKLTVVLDQ